MHLIFWLLWIQVHQWMWEKYTAWYDCKLSNICKYKRNNQIVSSLFIIGAYFFQWMSCSIFSTRAICRSIFTCVFVIFCPIVLLLYTDIICDYVQYVTQAMDRFYLSNLPSQFQTKTIMFGQTMKQHQHSSIIELFVKLLDVCLCSLWDSSNPT